MAVKSQGTQLYFIDPADDSVVEVACITELTGLSQSRDQIDTTCLSDNERSFEAGLASPGVANFGIYTDPAEASHVRLQQLAVAGTTIEWAAGWSDGTVAPVAISAGTFDQTPVARTFLYFTGYISDFPFDFAQNAVVASNLGIQTSGPTVWIPRT